MITHTLKSWLKKLFAWWPWQRSTQIGYAQSSHSSIQTRAQDTWLGTHVESSESSHPQPEGRSVAVEQEEILSHNDPGASDKHHDVQSDTLPARQQTSLPPLPPTVSSRPEKNQSSHQEKEQASLQNQHLEFLHYLVSQRIFNEGFEEGQEPEQYQRK